MSKRFDDTIRKQLEAQESPVPEGMFDTVSNHPEVKDALFDGAIRQKLNEAQVPVVTGFFEKIQEAADLENLPFDTGISSRLADYSSPVPADMWRRITEQPRRRRPVAWWWLAATLLFLLGGFVFFGVRYYNLQDTDIWKQPAHKPANNDATTLTYQSTTDTNVLKGIAAKQQPVKNDSAEMISGTEIKTTGQQNQVLQDSGDAGIYLHKQVKGTSRLPFNNQRFINALSSYPLLKNRKASGNKEIPVPDKSNAGNAPLLPENNESEMATARLTFLGIVRSNSKLSPGHLLQAKPRSPIIPCPVTGSQHRNDWYVDAYASALLLNKQIQTAGVTNSKNAKAGFDSTLHRQVSFNAGINLVKNIGENFLLKTGVQYTRINEAFRLTQINERKLVTTISVRTVIISPGDTVIIRDTSVTEHIGTILRGRQNAYTQWDVPVIVGYEFGGSNIRINANAGIIANIRTSYQGNILDTLQQVQDINSVNGQSLYRTRVGISLYAGFSLLKPLTERASLLIEPHARIGLGNTAADNAWFTQKNTLMGISIGIRYKLNGGRQRYY